MRSRALRAGAVPIDQQQASSPPSSLKPLHPFVSEQPTSMITAGALVPAGQDPQPLPHVGATEHPKRPTPLATKKRTRRSRPPSAPGDLTERRRRRKIVAQSRVDVQNDAAKLTTSGDFVAAGQQAGQPQPPPADSSDQRVGLSHSPAYPAPTPPADISGMASSSLESASTSQAAPSSALPGPTPPTPPNTHLYYWLATCSTDYSAKFNVRRAFSPGQTAFPHAHLLDIHRLLAQPSITASEAGAIIRASEEVSIPTDYQLPSRFFAKKPIGAALALHLSAALNSFKHGIPPSMATTVQLKRNLFKCKKYCTGMEEGKWDPGREDDDGADGCSDS
ncbi:hypothetical protein Esti_006164 [Eimeria stiedai]